MDSQVSVSFDARRDETTNLPRLSLRFSRSPCQFVIHGLNLVHARESAIHDDETFIANLLESITLVVDGSQAGSTNQRRSADNDKRRLLSCALAGPDDLARHRQARHAVFASACRALPQDIVLYILEHVERPALVGSNVHPGQPVVRVATVLLGRFANESGRRFVLLYRSVLVDLTHATFYDAWQVSIPFRFMCLHVRQLRVRQASSALFFADASRFPRIVSLRLAVETLDMDVMETDASPWLRKHLRGIEATGSVRMASLEKVSLVAPNLTALDIQCAQDSSSTCDLAGLSGLRSLCAPAVVANRVLSTLRGVSSLSVTQLSDEARIEHAPPSLRRIDVCQSLLLNVQSVLHSPQLPLLTHLGMSDSFVPDLTGLAGSFPHLQSLAVLLPRLDRSAAFFGTELDDLPRLSRLVICQKVPSRFGLRTHTDLPSSEFATGPVPRIVRSGRITDLELHMHRADDLTEERVRALLGAGCALRSLGLSGAPSRMRQLAAAMALSLLTLQYLDIENLGREYRETIAARLGIAVDTVP